jgi:hypothetical protein
VRVFAPIALACILFAGFAIAAARADAPVPSAGALAVPSPSPAPEDPKVTKLAIREFLAWQSASIDASHYTDQVAEMLTPAFLKSGTATLAHVGALQSATFRGIAHGVDHTDFFVYRMTCSNGTIDMDFQLDPAGSGKINLIHFE